jgi:hypothetical protein
MAKPTRSPLLGYNHNVKYKGRIYHAQTEDSGPANPHLFTHLYHEGTIVATMRHEYDRESPDELVRRLMQGQHKAILKELRHGVHDERLIGFFRTHGEQLVRDDASPDGAVASAAPDRDGDGADATPDRAPMRTERTPTLPEMEAFDLDSLPASVIEALGPELMPQPAERPAGGPGIYAMKGHSEYPPPAAPAPGASATGGPRPRGGIRAPRPSDPMMPLVIFDDDPGTTPALPARAPAPPFASAPSSRPAPGMTIHPPARPAGVGNPRARPGQVPPQAAPPIRPPVNAGVAVPVRPVVSAGTTRGPTPDDSRGVVVQRQVGIGSSAMAQPGAAVRRRPAPPVPYVVKEGSHPTVGQASPYEPRQPAPAMPPPIPIEAAAPPTPRAVPPPPPAEAMVTADKSLDEVILAYLSQGDGQD